MKARIVGEGRTWGDKRFGKVTDMLMLGAVIATTSSKPRGVVFAKFYKSSRGTVVYCTINVDGRRGVGEAGGWGYHKTSAALDSAIYDAGFALYGNPYGSQIPNESLDEYRGKQHIDGRGEGSIVLAIEAVARAVTGDRNVNIIHI